MRIRRSIAWLPFLVATSLTPAHAEFELVDAFPNLAFDFAVDIQVPGSASNNNRIFVVEKRGVISVFPELSTAQTTDRTVFLDISAKVRNFGEAGLLGLAFHPNYETNGYFFVYYVSPFPYRNIVARYQVSGNPDVANPNSELILIDDPKNNLFHNGGQLVFGPGNLMYIAVGDDQSSANGQDLNDLQGSILRVFPNVTGASPPYTIPNGNPFKGNLNGYREEIFAYGFRNPWRFSIDPLGQIWVADVGENSFEEVNVIELGGNYGWPLMEGPDCFQPSSCDTTGKQLKLPRDYYDHSVGSAVIGGYVYLGTRLPELQGRYIMADLNGIVWSLNEDGVNPPVRVPLVSNAPGVIAFGVGNEPAGELYISSIDGSIYRLNRILTATDTPPARGNRLLGNFPNPFNPATTIRYQLETPGRVVVEIVTVGGSRVKRLEAGTRKAGVHEVGWRGETDTGGRAASGVYFYRLIVDGIVRDAARMVLVQ